MTRVLSIALLVLGCGHPAPPAATPGDTHVPPAHTAPAADAAPGGPLDRDLPRLAERAVKLYQDIVAAFAEGGEDCAAVTAKLTALKASYADVTAANAKILHEGRARELRAALDPHAAELEPAAKAIVDSPTMKKCGSDRAFADTFDSLVGAPP